MSKSVRQLISHGLVVSALSFPLWAGTAAAELPPASAVISFGDSDLSTDAGAQALYQRIKAAANFVCYRETTLHPGIDQQARYFSCYGHAVARAVKQLGQERLTALHRDQSRLAAN
jgi:UrcA family protein